MKVLVDTCIWSLALRRRPDFTPTPEVLELEELIREVRVQIIGPVRQEILSGIKNRQQFDKLKKILAAFPDLPVSTNDYEIAAAYFNIAQSKGIQGSNTDFLICAVAASHHIPIFSTDKDFQHYQHHLPISLYIPRHRPNKE